MIKIKKMFRLGVISVLSICLMVPNIAVAFGPADYKDSNILYYDPNSQDCSIGSSAISPTAGSIPADEAERARIILEYLTSQKGLTLAQATGFVGNMHAESGLNPAIIQGGAIAPSNYTPKNTVGFGLVQWTFTPRQKPLVELAKSQGKPITDMYVQLDYVWQELNGSYKATLQTLGSIPNITPEQAAIVVHGRTPKVRGDPRFNIAPSLGYEASADSADGIFKNRVAYAKKYYDMFRSTIKDGAGISGGVTNSAVTPVSSGCSSTGPTEGCSATSPITGTKGSGGNGQQLKAPDLIKLYGKGGPAVVPKLVSVDFLGMSVKVHERVAGCLKAVNDELKKNNETYKVKTIGAYREQLGAGQIKNKEDMYHYYGIAVDINAATNGYYEGKQEHPHDMPDSVVKAFKNHGWSWGGAWSSPKDYMHFEFNGIDPGSVVSA